MIKLVFIHRSIKTRIETTRAETERNTVSSFLYIDPLKQGLKPSDMNATCKFFNLFLYIDPLKQGLKLQSGVRFLSIDIVFIHRSIKTRIETH